MYYTQNFSAQYIDELDDLPTLDLDILNDFVERLVMASAPWQVWAMRIRAVYRWEQPAVTGRWLALYVVLWYINRIPSFLWAYAIFFVMRQRFFPSTVKRLEASIKRTQSKEGRAFGIAEFIDRHGRDDWLDPLLDALGPYIQLQVGDLADLLEMLANFYTWKSPRKTAATLFLFAIGFLISVCGSARFNLKIVWFLAGGWFFLCWPIASLYPRYRFLVSPLRWVYWDVPTHADCAFVHLRQQADASRAAIVARKAAEGMKDDKRLDHYEGKLELPPEAHGGFDGANGHVPGTDMSSTDDEGDSDDDWHSVSSFTDYLAGTDLATFPASWSNTIGRLVVHANGIRFERLVRRGAVVWDVPYHEICELRKFRSEPCGVGRKRRRKDVKMRTGHALEIVCADGRVLGLETLRERDEAFNWIVGFSGERWQSLQPRVRGAASGA